MKTVEECPCAKINEDYPYEGFMTKHKCILKIKMSGACDQETIKGCRLFECMQDDSELRDFIRNWME